VFELPIIDGRAFWLVVFAFYIYDNLCLVDDQHIVILEDYRLDWTFKFANIPFVISKRQVYFLNVFAP
jgi:hypothetical protein